MDIFQDQQTERYYKTLLKHCAKHVRISFFTIIISRLLMNTGFACGTTYLGDQMAYHNDLRNYHQEDLWYFFD